MGGIASKEIGERRGRATNVSNVGYRQAGERCVRRHARGLRRCGADCAATCKDTRVRGVEALNAWSLRLARPQQQQEDPQPTFILSCTKATQGCTRGCRLEEPRASSSCSADAGAAAAPRAPPPAAAAAALRARLRGTSSSVLALPRAHREGR